MTQDICEIVVCLGKRKGASRVVCYFAPTSCVSWSHVIFRLSKIYDEYSLQNFVKNRLMPQSVLFMTRLTMTVLQHMMQRLYRCEPSRRGRILLEQIQEILRGLHRNWSGGRLWSHFLQRQRLVLQVEMWSQNTRKHKYLNVSDVIKFSNTKCVCENNLVVVIETPVCDYNKMGWITWDPIINSNKTIQRKIMND